MKASFFKRLVAYFIDILFISMIVSLITTGISTTKQEKILEKQYEIIEKYGEEQITLDEYNKELGLISYDLQKANLIPSTITLVLSVAYFIVFQYLNKGQTLGKKMLRLRVQEKGEPPRLKSIIIRTIIINNILSMFLAITLIYVLSRNNYYSVYGIISTVESVFIFASAILILYRKDKLGLHDIIAHTQVIDERGR